MNRSYRALTVGELREAIADASNDTLVAIWSVPSAGYVRASGVEQQASDAVPGPAGTNPTSEDTIAMLLIDSHETDTGGCI